MESKKTIIEQYRMSENDTGSPEVQVALLTARINHLNEHLAEDGWPSPQPAGLPAEEGRGALPCSDRQAGSA